MNERECNYDRETLSAYLDEELSGENQEDLESHLSDCVRCQRIYEELNAVQSTVKSLAGNKAPDGFLFGVRKEISKQHSSSMSEEPQEGVSNSTAEEKQSSATSTEKSSESSSGNTISLLGKFGAIAAGILLAILVTGILGPSDRAEKPSGENGSATVAKNESSARKNKKGMSERKWKNRLKREEAKTGGAVGADREKDLAEQFKGKRGGGVSENLEKRSPESAPAAPNRKKGQEPEFKKLSQKEKSESKTDSDRAHRPAMQKQKVVQSRMGRSENISRKKGQTCMLTMEHSRDRMQIGLLKSLRHLDLKTLDVSLPDDRTISIDLTEKNAKSKLARVLSNSTGEKAGMAEQRQSTKNQKELSSTGVVELSLTLSLNEAKILLGSLNYQGFKIAVYPPLELSRFGQANLWNHMNNFRTSSTGQDMISQEPEEFLGNRFKRDKLLNKENRGTVLRRKILQNLNKALLFSRQKMLESNIPEVEAEAAGKKESSEKEEEAGSEEGILNAGTIIDFCKQAPNFQAKKHKPVIPDSNASTRELISAWVNNLTHVDIQKLKKSLSRKEGKEKTENNQGNRNRQKDNLLTIIYLNVK